MNKSPVVAVLQNPRLVQPIESAIFMDSIHPYDPGRAADESDQLRAVLQDCGLPVVVPSEILLRCAREDLLGLASAALASNDAERLAKSLVTLNSCSRSDLVDIILRQPQMLTDLDAELAKFSPDQAYETFVIRPLLGMIYPRDLFVDLAGEVVLGRMRRRDRVCETAVISLVLERLRGRAVDIQLGNEAFLEGGDVAVTGSTIWFNVGFRSSEKALEPLWPLLEKTFDEIVFVLDGRRRPAEFHLDSWLTLGSDVALVSVERLDSLEEAACGVYRTAGGDRRIPDLRTTLRTVLLDRNIAIVDIPKSKVEQNMANAFFVPGTASVVVPEGIGAETVSLLESHDRDVRAVPFGEHHKQSGGIHCAVNTVTDAQAGLRAMMSPPSLDPYEG